MTDNTNSSSPAPLDVNAMLAEHFPEHAEHQRRIEALRPDNKAVLFDALAAAGISRIVLSCDGYGDSGQVESVEAYAGDDLVDVPQSSIEQSFAEWDSPTPATRLVSIEDALEKLAYEFLEQTHGGWENNDGAYGDFTFDVADRSIVLNYNERYTASESYQHEF